MKPAEIKLKLGMYGSAYDAPNEIRAYTYKEQPDNLVASRLGSVSKEEIKGGDNIDFGLSLLKNLEKYGFGVFQIPNKDLSK